MGRENITTLKPIPIKSTICLTRWVTKRKSNFGTKSQYWNGDDWVSEKSTVMAEVISPKGIVTDWRYRFSPSKKSTKLENIDLNISVKVFDLQGNSAEQKNAKSLTLNPDESKT